MFLELIKFLKESYYFDFIIIRNTVLILLGILILFKSICDTILIISMKLDGVIRKNIVSIFNDYINSCLVIIFYLFGFITIRILVASIIFIILREYSFQYSSKVALIGFISIIIFTYIRRKYFRNFDEILTKCISAYADKNKIK